MPKTPNPGSDQAREQGCICPRMDNARGRGYFGGNGKDWGEGGVFVVVVDCSVHPSLDAALAPGSHPTPKEDR